MLRLDSIFNLSSSFCVFSSFVFTRVSFSRRVSTVSVASLREKSTLLSFAFKSSICFSYCRVFCNIFWEKGCEIQACISCQPTPTSSLPSFLFSRSHSVGSLSRDVKPTFQLPGGFHLITDCWLQFILLFLNTVQLSSHARLVTTLLPLGVRVSSPVP